MTVFRIDGIAPEFDDAATNWIAPGAAVIGRVRIGRDVGIWFGAVIRGDNDVIRIGARTNVQEHASLTRPSVSSALLRPVCSVNRPGNLFKPKRLRGSA